MCSSVICYIFDSQTMPLLISICLIAKQRKFYVSKVFRCGEVGNMYNVRIINQGMLL